MQGQRTDKQYDKILKYIAKNQPIAVGLLHNYLAVKYGITLGRSRSRLLAKLQNMGLITRVGNPLGNKSTFLVNK